MRVDIWSDVVCPWCYIGKRRFEAALDRFAHAGDVEVRWRSFELDPSAPQTSDQPVAEHLADKYGVSLEQAEAMQDRVRDAAAAEGLRYRFDLARRGNTFDAHRLLHLAADHGVQGRLKERLMAAYFTEGAAIGDAATLVRLAGEAGLDETTAAEALETGAYAEAVRADEAQARRYRIGGVPFFVVDGAYGVSGAQPAELLAEVLDKAWAESHPLHVVGAGGGECADGSCDV